MYCSIRSRTFRTISDGSYLTKYTPASIVKTGKGTARKRQTSYRQLNFKRKVTAWIGSRGRLLFLFILLILRAILRNTTSPRVSPGACCSFMKYLEYGGNSVYSASVRFFLSRLRITAPRTLPTASATQYRAVWSTTGNTKMPPCGARRAQPKVMESAPATAAPATQLGRTRRGSAAAYRAVSECRKGQRSGVCIPLRHDQRGAAGL